MREWGVTMRLLMICAAGPERPHFPGDDAASLPALARIRRPNWPNGAIYLASTWLRAQQTCQALGISARPEPALNEADFGSWKTRSPAEVMAAEPAHFSAWLSDPETAPPGGEAFADLAARIGAFLRRIPDEAQGKSVVAITHPGPIQAAILSALDAPLTSAARISVAPGSQTRLSFDGRRWALCAGIDAPAGPAP